MADSPVDLILASASPRRRELLDSLSVEFEVQAAPVTEREESAGHPRELVAFNAALKANWVARRHPTRWVLGADTTVVLNETIMNKPRDAAEARDMLRRLSGRRHAVLTGLALRRLDPAYAWNETVQSMVAFRPLDEAMIEAYLARVHTLDKAGGYAIQEFGEMIVERHEGSFSNIVGLPIEATKQILTEVGLLG